MKCATATSNSLPAKGNCSTSPTRASTPRARVSSTMRSDWSSATTSSPARTSRSASSPRPQPTSSTRRGDCARTSSNATSTARGPVRRDQIEIRADKPVSSAYSRRTTSRASCASATRAGVRLLVGSDLGADLFERAPDQTRDVHLRNADLLRDLGLGQAVEEPQLEDHPLALVERTEARRQDGAVLGHLVLVLLAADRLERVEILVAVAPAAR